jgi:hypothetical protein
LIVWLASFPRSGNTFLRIVLHRMYGLRASTVYDVDGVAERVGADLIGYEDRPGTIDEMRSAATLHLVKTHSARHAAVAEEDRAICLVRDGRDAVVSWARLRAAPGEQPYRDQLETVIARPRDRGAGHWDSGSWGTNVLSWLRPPAPHRRLLRFEDLVRDPVPAVAAAIDALAPELEAQPAVAIPSFAELNALDGGFFRRGVVGTHAEELPDDLERAFWAREDNAAAMDLLGYGPAPA